MITRIPRSSFSANINNTAQTNEHQTLSELFYKELEDKFSGKELATPLLKSFSENCRQNGRHIFSNKDFVIKFSTVKTFIQKLRQPGHIPPQIFNQ